MVWLCRLYHSFLTVCHIRIHVYRAPHFISCLPISFTFYYHLQTISPVFILCILISIWIAWQPFVFAFRLHWLFNRFEFWSLLCKWDDEWVWVKSIISTLNAFVRSCRKLKHLHNRWLAKLCSGNCLNTVSTLCYTHLTNADIEGDNQTLKRLQKLKSHDHNCKIINSVGPHTMSSCVHW